MMFFQSLKWNALMFTPIAKCLATVLTLFFLVVSTSVGQQNSKFPDPTNSEKSDFGALAPAESLKQLKLPPGFKATVFASEPDIQQPIAFQFDTKGRLWVAEGYTYAEQALNYDLRLRDRILIFEDTDNNGVFDTRKVFWEGSQRLTGIEIGFDGVYALTLPELVFLPDLNHDDIPDSPPVVLLDGFNHAQARHTMANGLSWGPDGWLYGRQGILGTSLVGKPGSTDSKRTSLNVGVWRFHPQTHQVEVFTSGTTNPWGMDWDSYGEAFHINTVIGHLWHAIPGAHFRRMFGEDPNPNVFQLIEQHADHFHWDTKETWSDVRSLGVTPTSSLAGGGHAHTGLMIYLGDNWPSEYRGDVFTINYHGRRLNRDHLEAVGSGFVGKHNSDVAFWGDKWFRGIDLKYGPDGGVYVADWSDTGECHDHDGVHRISGRMYKITYGQPNKPTITDVKSLNQSELLQLVEHANEWFVRQGRIELQRRAVRNLLDKSHVLKFLTHLIENEKNPVFQVRAILALHAAGLDSEEMLKNLLGNSNPHLRIWAIRLLTDPSKQIENKEDLYSALVDHCASEKEPSVRLAYASALRHIPLSDRGKVAKNLLQFSEDANDHNQPMIIWYGIEPLAVAQQLELAKLFETANIPLVRKWIIRRLALDYDQNQVLFTEILNNLANKDIAFATDFMSGLSEGMVGRRNASKPKGWDSFVHYVQTRNDKKTNELLMNLNAFFGDGIAIESIRRIAIDSNTSLSSRRQALRTLIEARSPDLKEDCRSLFLVKDLSSIAAQGLILFDDSDLADETIDRLSRLNGDERAQVIHTFTSKPNWAMKILEAVESGKLSRDDISALMARQIRSHNQQKLNESITRVWGSLRESSQERRNLIEKWKAELSKNNNHEPNLENGRNLFLKNCSSCHKMYGEGGTSGPELTGSNRDNLDYLLQNIIDPSSVVPANYRLSMIDMKDGRLLSGVIISKNDVTVGIQTATERLFIDAGDILQIKETDSSLMPDGLLQNLSNQEVRDLIDYLRNK